MFNSFRKAQARSRKQFRKATATAIGQMAGAMVPTPPTSKAKAKPARKSKTTGGGRAISRVVVGAKVPTLKGGKALLPSATARSRMPKPRGASFRTLTHDGLFGGRDYKLYLPACAGLKASPLPVLVMLHGCGQTPHDFAIGTGMNALAEELGVIIIYPAQDRRAQPNRCWNWYRAGDQARGSGEPAILAGLTAEVLTMTSADPARVYVAGLSAGASMAMVLGATYPDIFAAVGVHSGLPWGAARDAGTAAVAMNSGAPGHRLPAPMPTIIFHGEEDRIVNVRNARYIATRASNAYTGSRKTERTGHVPNGHAYVRQSHRRGKGRSFLEYWLIKDAGHAWSGGSRSGRFADPSGPDASREMLRFFLQHRTTMKHRKAMRTVGIV